MNFQRLDADSIAHAIKKTRRSSSSRNFIGNRIVVLDETPSTNDHAQKLAAEGHAEGLVVFAETQTGGRGRQGRRWHSPPGQGLWFSILLRPTIRLEKSSRITLATAVAVVTALRMETQLPLRIKWPNDILCRGLKVGGILVEMSTHSQQVQHAVVGIGINVNLDRADFPPELQSLATSLSLEAGQKFSRPELATRLLVCQEKCMSQLDDPEWPSLLQQWRELNDTLGKQVRVHHPQGLPPLEGLATDLDEDGALLLRRDSGVIERIVTGEIHLS